MTMFEAARMAANMLTADLPHLFDDVQQDALLWCIEHPKDVSNSQLPDGTYHVEQLAAKIRRALHRAVEAEREQAYRGARPYVSRYDVRTVEAVLPHLLDSTSSPPKEDHGEGGGGKVPVDPARFQQWTVYRADVTNALLSLDEYDRELLVSRFISGLLWDEMASRFDLAKTTVYRRSREALERLVDSLNGDVPSVAGRRVMSNAEARAVTEHQYGG